MFSGTAFERFAALNFAFLKFAEVKLAFEKSEVLRFYDEKFVPTAAAPTQLESTSCELLKS